MKVVRIEKMTRGWFVGDFEPTLHPTRDVEVAVQHFKAGDREAAHYHKIASEITVLVRGEATMNGRRLTEGDVVVLAPGEASDFQSVTDCTTTVVKIPGAPDDKYLV